MTVRTFVGANGSPLSSAWSADSGLTIQSNAAKWGGGGPGAAIDQTPQPSKAHYCKVKFAPGTTGTNSWAGCVVRSNASGSERLHFECGQAATYLYRRTIAGGPALVATIAIGWADDDELYVTCAADDTITAFKGTTQFYQGTESAITGTYTGISMQNTVGGGISVYDAGPLVVAPVVNDPVGVVVDGQDATVTASVASSVALTAVAVTFTPLVGTALGPYPMTVSGAGPYSATYTGVGLPAGTYAASVQATSAAASSAVVSSAAFTVIGITGGGTAPAPTGFSGAAVASGFAQGDLKSSATLAGSANASPAAAGAIATSVPVVLSGSGSGVASGYANLAVAPAPSSLTVFGGQPLYATIADLIRRYGEPEILQLSDRDQTGLVGDNVCLRALADASIEMDSYLGVRYPLPLSPVPAMANLLCCEIARYRLYEDSATQEVRQRYVDASNKLFQIGAGKITLGVAESSAGGAAAPTSAGLPVTGTTSSTTFGDTGGF